MPVMSVKRIDVPGGAILFEDTLARDMSNEKFSVERYLSAGRMIGSAGGRGTVSFVRGDSGEWAIRHYQRGGFIGRWLHDHFWWAGETRARSFAEWMLLRELRARRLPVPIPVAARFLRHGLAYTADLITVRIPGASPLSERLAQGRIADNDWHAVGSGVRRFHEEGVYHADLTGHNILVDESGSMHLLDFDRGRIRAPGAWRRANLARLERSLRKISATTDGVQVTGANWQSLLKGYDSLG